MRIPEVKVDEVRDASDIVDVVGEYVSLKRQGSRYVGLCPFHNEKTPSFGVNPNMGIYKCFGCGKAGNVFGFLMEVENVGFVEAVRMLAERANIALPEAEAAQDEQTSETESIYHALRFAARFFYDQLTQTETGKKVGLAYFQGRGFTPETIKKFGLGYAPDARHALLKAAEEQHVNLNYLEKAGLVARRELGSAPYDRFRGRVMFPLFSHVGKVLGFAGRILEDGARTAKYINSPETEVYHKSRVLYGLHQGKDVVRRQRIAMLVEGYTDVISLHQAGIRNVVASSGTALTREQVQLLKRYAGTIYLLYDADNAGTNAALRGINLVLAEDLEVYIVPLPDGSDPDSFVQQFGGDAFRNFVEKHRQDFIQFKHDVARRNGDMDTPAGELRTVQSILTSIAQIPNPIKQDAYLRQAGSELGIPDVRLRPEMDKILRTRRKEQQRQSRREARRAQPVSPPVAPPELEPAQEALPPAQPAPPPEKKLIQLMLNHGDPMVELVLGHMGFDEFTAGIPRRTVEQLVEMYQQGSIRREAFLEGRFGGAAQQFVADVLVQRHELSDNWNDRHNIEVPSLDADPKESAISAMTILKLARVDEAIAKQRRALYHAQQTSQDVLPILNSIKALENVRRHIESHAYLKQNN